MFVLIIRTIILYFYVIIIMRMMGKRQIGELEPFELVIALMVSELASLPMQDNRIPLLHAIVPITTLLMLQIIISVLELKSEKARILINGKPSILIKDGKIDIEELRYQRFNLDDLMEELRLKGFYDLCDIQYAILETGGELSIIPKIEASPATKADLNIKTYPQKLPLVLISDGNINTRNLKALNKTTDWLNNQLKNHKISSEKEVFIALLDSKNTFFYQLKDEKTSSKKKNINFLKKNAHSRKENGKR